MRLMRRLLYLFRQRRLEADLAEEMAYHRLRKREEFERGGMSSDEAAVATQRTLGNVTLAREDARGVWISRWMDVFWQDLRYAMRNLRRQPGFTIVAVAVLTAGIGLNTALFALFSGVVLRPWTGVAEPERVVRVFGQHPDLGRTGVSLPEYRHLAGHARSISGLSVFRTDEVRLDDDPNETTRVTLVSGNFFEVLGVRTARGRVISQGDDRSGAPRPVAVISHALWHDRFNAAVDILGRQIRLDGAPFEVVGVASAEFTGSETGPSSVWIPFEAMAFLDSGSSSLAGLQGPGNCCSHVVGRLSDNVNFAQATSELTLLSRAFRAAVPSLTDRPIVVTGTSYLPSLFPGEQRQVLGAFAAMFVATLLVLLLACANVGNLLLARAAARGREIGVRLSLGASRRRVVRQLLTEGFVLSVISGVSGALVAREAVPLLLRRAEFGGGLPSAAGPSFLVYAVGLGCLSCLVFGLAPALHATRPDLTSTLKDGVALPHAPMRLRNALLCIQVAVSVIFLSCAGLFLRGAQHGLTLDLGFAIDDVVVVSLAFPAGAYDAERKGAFLSQVGRQFGTADGGPVGLAQFEPLESSRARTPFRLPGRSEAEAVVVDIKGVSGGYFDVLGIPIVAGRNFTDTDAGSRAVLVNESLARRFWPGASAVGKAFTTGLTRPEQHEVIGVVKDAQTESLGRIEPMVYSGFDGWPEPKLLLRKADVARLGRLDSIVKGIDPRARVQANPLSANLQDVLGGSRRSATVAGLLGALALCLAAVGMFGVFAYVVQQRTREIGVRMALGAQRADVVWLVLGGNAPPVLAGLVVGLSGAIGAARLFRGLLFGLSPLDPIAHAGVVTLLAMTALAASYVPARRAARVDPMTALRYE